jgi:hypothetical protein
MVFIEDWESGIMHDIFGKIQRRLRRDVNEFA